MIDRIIGPISVGLAAYEVYAWSRHKRLLSHQHGIALKVLFAWWLALGAHFAYEAITDDIGQAAARSFGDTTSGR